MNDENRIPNPFNPPSPERYDPSREDILVGRVVDSEAGPADWAELELIAKSDPALWQRLAQAQRAHARLERAVEDEIAVAELVELPPPISVVASFRSRWQTWGGWAVAAAIALVWLGAGNGPAFVRGNLPGSQPGANIGNTAGLLTNAAPEELLQGYLDRGRQNNLVLSQGPLQLINARELGPGQGKEVIYIRPIVERMIVTDFRALRVTQDETGRSQEVPAERLPLDVLRNVSNKPTQD
ncbi:MAG: hypothetical protein ACKVZJ_05295 [Phycisphaerales bacterium]